MRIKIGVVFTAMALAGAANAAPVSEGVRALAGTWQAEEIVAAGVTPTSFQLVIEAPAELTAPLVARARLSPVAGAPIEPLALEIVRSGDAVYGLTGAGGTPEGAFAVAHAPFGGLQLTRLAKVASEEQLTVRAEAIGIGRPQADGSRRVKITRGERLCRDASAAATACGAGEARTYVMRMATQ